MQYAAISKDPSRALLQDFYQLTMAYAYFKAGIAHRKACFHLFFRRPPFKGGFTIASGLEAVVNFIDNFHFDQTDLEYLASLKKQDNSSVFDSDFLHMLSKIKLGITLHAVPEGTAVFPYEPLIRVQGSLLECQLLESPLLNLINFPTLIATKAARVCLAAAGDPVLEFGMRRAQGIDGALTASRAAYVGGCSGTSNVLAGKCFDIPVQGTHAHSWIMAFDDEEEAFMEYAKIMPDNCILLVDTYDTIEGVKKAIKVGLWLKSQGKKLIGIRLDSGDLAELSIQSRKLLDNAGLPDTVICASNELDEIVISELKRQGAKISMWGVGTNLVTAKDQAALDGVYKLSAHEDEKGEWKYSLKLSEQLAKVSNPGILQVKRYVEKDSFVGDIIYDSLLGMRDSNENVDPFDPTKQLTIPNDSKSYDLLLPIYNEGEKVYTMPTLREIRQKTQTELAYLPVGIKRFLNPHVYPVVMEKQLHELKLDLIKNIRKKRMK